MPQILKQKSYVAGVFCAWVRAIEEYHKALKIASPKLAEKKAAKVYLKKLEQQLQDMQDEFIAPSDLDQINKEEVKKQHSMTKL